MSVYLLLVMEFDLLLHLHIRHSRTRFWRQDATHASFVLGDNLAVLYHVNEVLRPASFDAESVPTFGLGNRSVSAHCVDGCREGTIYFDHLVD